MRAKTSEWRTHLLVAIATAATVYALAPGCSLGQGSGVVSGTLNVPTCWSGKFDLQPDFFAAVPYRDSLTIRVQNGSDFETFSDGISILVDNVHVIRGDGTFSPGALHTPLKVSLPPNVTPPGVPVQAVANPAAVHLTLYLQRTCHTQNVALYAVDQVTLNADGSCDPGDSGPLPVACPPAAPGPGPADGGSSAADAGGTNDGGVTTDAGAVDASLPDAAVSEAGASDAGPTGPMPTASSSITFDSLFNGNPDETDADQRHTVVPSFDVYLADPRDICPGGLGPPPPCRGHLTGRFDFYFERGRPAQPFP